MKAFRAILATVAIAHAAWACGAQRDQVLSALTGAHTTGDLGLSVTLEEAPKGHLIGAPIEIRLATSKPAYLSLIYVDVHGAVTAGAPLVGPAGNLLSAGTEYLLPSEDQKVPLLYARPPEGAV